MDTSAGVKHDQAKNRWDLLDFEFMDQCVKVLTFGAEKYTRNLFIGTSNYMLDYIKGELEKCPHVQSVRVTLRSGRLEECVEDVMTSNSSQSTRSTLNVNTKTQKNGTRKIKNESLNIRGDAAKILLSETGITRTGERIFYVNSTDCPLISPQLFMGESLVARFVKEYSNLIIDILTMTIKTEKCEESFVIGAIGELECLATLKNVLFLRYNIFENVLLKKLSKNYQLVSLGSNNWMKVERWRYVGALLRHISAYLQGESRDPETGCSHLAHAFCNLMFLFGHDKLLREKLSIGKTA